MSAAPCTKDSPGHEINAGEIDDIEGKARTVRGREGEGATQGYGLRQVGAASSSPTSSEQEQQSNLHGP